MGFLNVPQEISWSLSHFRQFAYFFSLSPQSKLPQANNAFSRFSKQLQGSAGHSTEWGKQAEGSRLRRMYVCIVLKISCWNSLSPSRPRWCPLLPGLVEVAFAIIATKVEVVTFPLHQMKADLYEKELRSFWCQSFTSKVTPPKRETEAERERVAHPSIWNVSQGLGNLVSIKIWSVEN